MHKYDVQAIEIEASARKVFEFLREPANLPKWAHAFQSAAGGRARLKTPAGEVEIGLATAAEPTAGTVDWRLEFADGTLGMAHSRVVETTRGTCIYSFVLHAPPVPLERLEGALAEQKKTLAKELSALKSILES
jgi:hypothetical protein